MSATGDAIGTLMKTLLDSYMATLTEAEKQNISEAERLETFKAMGHGIAPYITAEVPPGVVVPFAGSVAPANYLFCNNASLLRVGTYAGLFAAIGTIWGSVDGDHFNVPDFRGIALMGVGTSSKLVDANGAAFARVLGTYQNDKEQGLRNYIVNEISEFNTYGVSSAAGTGITNRFGATGGDADDVKLKTGPPIADGANGPPRIGTETNPANAGVNFIIKY